MQSPSIILSVEEYLAVEEYSDIRHEYVAVQLCQKSSQKSLQKSCQDLY